MDSTTFFSFYKYSNLQTQYGGNELGSIYFNAKALHSTLPSGVIQ